MILKKQSPADPGHVFFSADDLFMFESLDLDDFVLACAMFGSKRN